MTSQRSPSNPRDAALHALLDANVLLPTEYRDQLTNHLPMALHALHSLGASAQRMQDFYARYTQRFSALNSTEQAAPAWLDREMTWQSLRGERDSYAQLRLRFMDDLAQDGVAATLHRLLPELLPGVAAAAFHGVIRTAHAVESGHMGELAAALAYWASRWQPMAPATVPSALLDADAWSQCLVAQAVGWHSDGSLISTRMDQACHSQTYLGLAGALAPAVDLKTRIAQLAAFSMRAYARQPNFTVLHMITGMRAMRTLLPWLPDTAQSQAILVRASVAAYLAAHVVPKDTPAPRKVRSWAEVIAAAIASDDDHVIKLVHACLEEYAAYGHEAYLQVASLVTGGKEAL